MQSFYQLLRRQRGVQVSKIVSDYGLPLFFKLNVIIKMEQH